MMENKRSGWSMCYQQAMGRIDFEYLEVSVAINHPSSGAEFYKVKNPPFSFKEFRECLLEIVAE